MWQSTPFPLTHQSCTCRSNKKKPQNSLGGSHEALYRRRLSTEGGSDSGATSRGQSGHTSPVVSSPIRSPPYKHEQILPDDYANKYSSKNAVLLEAYYTLPVPESTQTVIEIVLTSLHVTYYLLVYIVLFRYISHQVQKQHCLKHL